MTAKPIRTVRTQQNVIEGKYTGSKKPEYKIGDYMRVYCGSHEGHCFSIKDVRFNYDLDRFEYLYGSFLGGAWYGENMIVPAGDRRGGSGVVGLHGYSPPLPFFAACRQQ